MSRFFMVHCVNILGLQRTPRYIIKSQRTEYSLLRQRACEAQHTLYVHAMNNDNSAVAIIINPRSATPTCVTLIYE